MTLQFALAQLSPEELSEIKLLEEKLRTQVNKNIVLIAYSESQGSSSSNENA